MCHGFFQYGFWALSVAGNKQDACVFYFATGLHTIQLLEMQF